MKYSKNAVYTSVRNAVKTAWPSAYVTGTIAAVPTKSPAVMIQEIGKIHNPETVTLSGLQPVWTSTFEVHVFSNLQNSGMSECYNIMETVTAAFVKIGYLLFFQDVLENGDNKKYRLVARFRRVTGVNDEMPE